jgi:hypothetical protein
MTTETYKITQEHIDKAIPSMPWEANPLSLAMLQEWGGFHMIHEDMEHITNTEIGRTYKMDAEGQSVVRRFSEGKKVEPCEVTVTLVDQNFYKFIQGGDMTKPTPAAVLPDAP